MDSKEVRKLKQKFFGDENIQTPRELGFRMPAEWESHRQTWLACLYLKEEWGDAFEGACEQWLHFAEMISKHGEPLSIALANHPVCKTIRGKLLQTPNRNFKIHFENLPYGDAWVRDTGPVFLTDSQGNLGAACFAFDGWGGSFEIEGDTALGKKIAEIEQARIWDIRFVLEGGAIEIDGQGTCLLNETCVLDATRNKNITKQEVQWLLGQTLGVEHCIWIQGTLQNDHTDGHIDTLARFIKPGVVLCMQPLSDSDPNQKMLEQISGLLSESKDAAGNPLKLEFLPSPGPIENSKGEILPASYCNYYLTNHAVFVPSYGVSEDQKAMDILQQLYPDRKTIHVPASAILTGGGALHCISKQVPMDGKKIS